MQLILSFLFLSTALAAPSPDKLAVAPPDGYLPAIDDSLGSYEGSGGEEGGSGQEEGEGRAAAGSGEEEEEGEGSLDGYQGSGGEGIQFDLPEYTDDADNLVQAEDVEEETTENPTEEITEEPIENNLVEGGEEEEADPDIAKNAGETYQAPPGPEDIPEGDPDNLPDVPPGPKDVAICPGGAVEVCVGVCPGTTARVYGACVQGCADRCAEAERQRRARALLLQLS